MLIALAAFNNLLTGVFMALLDAYGLSLVSVETWGFLFGGISMAFIVGGLLVARFGLGPLPLRTILLGNLVNWTVCSVFTAAVLDRAAHDRHVPVAAPRPGDRGGGADRAAAVDPVRAAGPGVRLRAAGRERGRADHRLPHRPPRGVRRDAVHDRRRRAPPRSATGSAPVPSAAWP